MEKKNIKLFIFGVILLLSFVLWTVLLQFVDVKVIGPNNSSVGFASINNFARNLIGVNMDLYVITDWLGLVPIAVCFSFGILGLVQLIKRKSILKVDKSILALGLFYLAVMVVYVLFEIIAINFRPVLINGCLEASYPSSTTMLVMCVMPTAIMQFNSRIKNKKLRHFIAGLLTAFIVFMVAARLISGVHWFTDIVAGTILSTGLVVLYRFAVGLGKTK